MSGRCGRRGGHETTVMVNECLPGPCPGALPGPRHAGLAPHFSTASEGPATGVGNLAVGRPQCCGQDAAQAL